MTERLADGFSTAAKLSCVELETWCRAGVLGAACLRLRRLIGRAKVTVMRQLSRGTLDFDVSCDCRPMYFGAGYVPLPKWLGMGFAISVLNIAVFAVVGGAWWRFLGIWP